MLGFNQGMLTGAGMLFAVFGDDPSFTLSYAQIRAELTPAYETCRSAAEAAYGDTAFNLAPFAECEMAEQEAQEALLDQLIARAQSRLPRAEAVNLDQLRTQWQEARDGKCIREGDRRAGMELVVATQCQIEDIVLRRVTLEERMGDRPSPTPPL